MIYKAIQRKLRGQFGSSGRIKSWSCTNDIRRVTIVTNPVVSHE